MVLPGSRLASPMAQRRVPGSPVSAVALGSGAAHGASTITVTSTADTGDPGTLRWAIGEANLDPGSTIDFAPGLTGIITLTSDLPTVTASTTILGPGSAVLGVSGDGAYRQVAVTGAITVGLSGLTLTNPDPTDAAAPALDVRSGATLLGDDLVISNTRTTGFFESTVVCVDATLSLSDTTITGNERPTSLGAAGILTRCVTTLTDSRVFANTAYDAPGLIAGGGSLTIVDSTLAGNVATRIGGAVYGSNAEVTVRGSTIAGNSGNGQAALGGYHANVEVTDSTISGNSSASGAIVRAHFGTLSLTQTTITGNTSSGPTVFGYQYRYEFTTPVSLTTVGTIIAGDTAPSEVGDAYGRMLWTSEASILGPTDSTITTDLGDNQTGVTDPGLAPLADNGGPTLTHALVPGSPAIDAGPATPPVFPGSEWDQRGEPYARVVGGAIDVGAFEVQPAGALTWAGATELPVGAATATLAARVDPAECRTGSLEFTVDGVPAGAADVDPVTGVGEITVPVPAGVTALVVDVRLVGSACSTEPLRVTVTITSDGLVPTFTG